MVVCRIGSYVEVRFKAMDRILLREFTGGWEPREKSTIVQIEVY